MAESELKTAALSYAAAGWAVFPLVPKGKAPATTHGYKDATTDVDALTWAWGVEPNFNVGVACGEMSGGLVVIDLDYHPDEGKDGPGFLHEWECEHGEFPETVTAESGSGGTHLYYRTSEPLNLSTNERLSIDIRANGSHIVAPPSVHPSGGVYVWENDPEEYPVAEADENVLAFIRYVQAEENGGKGGKKDGKGKPFEMPDVIPNHSRHSTLFSLACSLQAKGVDDLAILDQVRGANLRCQPCPLGDPEIKSIVDGAINYKKGTPAKTPNANKLAYGRCELSFQVREEIRKRLFKGMWGKVLPTTDNCITILNLDPNFKGRFYYDTRAYTIMCEGLPWSKDKRPRPIEDVDLVNLTAYSERNFQMGSKATWADAVASVARDSARNDVAAWLDSLEWDGVERIATLLPDFLGAARNAYTEDVMRLYMLAAVARAYSPGVKFDYMPVLVGKQGIGKSFFCSRLAVRYEWFEDDFNTVEPKRASELMRGKWQAEMAELLATKDKRNVNKVKSFLTKRVDNFRVPYDRYDQDRPRACVFIGTTNDASFLTDPTGNRRFLPVKCGVIEPVKSLWADEAEAYFAQAWAEAVHVWKTESPVLVLSGEAADVALQMQDEFLEDNPVLSLIQSHLDELGNKAYSNSEPRERVRVCVPMIRHEWLEQPFNQAIQGGREANEIHALMQNNVMRWTNYPNNNHRARCRGGGAYAVDYKVQRCYIPAEGAYPFDRTGD